MHMAILIAVEAYADAAIPPVRYAAADALQFGRALADLGFEEADQVVLVDGQATKADVESGVREAAQSLGDGDTLFLYYAGRHFSENGQNYLTCHNTEPSDLVGTSIPLDSLLGPLGESKCGRIAMFFDSCESGLRGADLDSTAEQLAEFFEARQRSVCFAACRAGEQSYPSHQFKHGVWAHHLIEAFRGDVSSALTSRSRLTAASLQKYLQAAVPRTLRLEHADKKHQTPWMLGATSGGFLLADLTDILARGNGAADPHSDQVLHVSFVRREYARVRSLSGFQRTHRVPDEVNDRSETFVATIAADQLGQDLDAMHRALRQAFRFKRADIDVSQPGDGTGTMITPYFNYSISVSLNSDDTTEVVWHRQVSDIKEPEQILTDEFAQVFGGMFDTVELSPATKIDVETLIDRIEEFGDDRVALHYDKDATWCRLEIDGVVGEIEVTRRTFSIVQSSPKQPKQLLELLFEIQKSLLDKYDVRLMAFES